MLKKLAPLLIAALLMITAAGCAPQSTPGQDPTPGSGGNTPPSTVTPDLEPTPPDETIDVVEPSEPVLFTDSLDREVLVSQPLSSILPGNLAARSILFSLAPEKMTGATGKDGTISAEESFRNLPAYQENGAIDTNALQNTGAELLLYMGAGMKAEELDAISEQTGLPVLYIESGLDALSQAYRTLGGLLGREEQAEDYVDYLNVSIADLAENLEGIPESERKSVYIASGAQGLTPLDSAILPLAGAVNAAPSPYKALSFEELKALPIDIAITSSASVYEALKSEAEWQALEFIQMGLFYQSPTLLYSWLPTDLPVQQILCAKWMGNLLYPDVFAYDMIQEVKLHYDMFWHVQLTDEEAEVLLADSTLKPIG